MKIKHVQVATVLFAALCAISTILFAAEFKSSFTSESQQGVYTSWNSGWKFAAPGTGTFFFTAKTANDIHIAISDSAETKSPMYEIVIGGWGNSSSAIRRESQGEVLKEEAKGIKNTEKPETYWVSINAAKSTVSAGYGTEAGKNIIIEWKDPEFLSKSCYFALSSWDTVIEYTGISLEIKK